MAARNSNENYIFHAIERSVRQHIQQIVDEEAQLAHARVLQRLRGEVDGYEHTAIISSIAGRADSLDFVEMLLELEKVSGFVINESELPDFKTCTIGDVVRLLASKMAKGEKG